MLFFPRDFLLATLLNPFCLEILGCPISFISKFFFFNYKSYLQITQKNCKLDIGLYQ